MIKYWKILSQVANNETFIVFVKAANPDDALTCSKVVLESIKIIKILSIKEVKQDDVFPV